MPKPTRRLREQVNSMVDPPRSVPQTLPERQPRAPIPARKGIGTGAQATGANETTGIITSADGMFVIPYSYHNHA